MSGEFAPETRFLSLIEAAVAGVGNACGYYELTREQVAVLDRYQRDIQRGVRKPGIGTNS